MIYFLAYFPENNYDESEKLLANYFFINFSVELSVNIQLLNILLLLLTTITEKHLALLERTLVLASIRTKSVQYSYSINNVLYVLRLITKPLLSTVGNNNTTSSKNQTIEIDGRSIVTYKLKFFQIFIHHFKRPSIDVIDVFLMLLLMYHLFLLIDKLIYLRTSFSNVFICYFTTAI